MRNGNITFQVALDVVDVVISWMPLDVNEAYALLDVVVPLLAIVLDVPNENHIYVQNSES